MADFSTPFSVMKSDRLLTHEELVRAIRFAMAAEFEATQLYQQIAESIDNPLARKVLLDVADEERVHAGEFLRLLKALQPDEEALLEQGAREVENEFLNPPGPEPEAAGPTSSRGLGVGSLRKKPSTEEDAGS
jgi:rubrerythrin